MSRAIVDMQDLTHTAAPAMDEAPVAHARDVIVALKLVPHRLTPEERRLRISELAYRRAAARGFTPGGEVEDWLEAEREVDAGRY
jgi:hypothetical protein